MPGMRTLITGGVKSGKSSKALELALASFDKPRIFLATAEAIDAEMEERIKTHRQSRGVAFETIEEPLYIDRHTNNNLILDCVTIWINNVLHYEKEPLWERMLADFLRGLGENAIIVTNETGLGNIPADAFTRHYNRLLGKANVTIASFVDRVLFMVSGFAVQVK